MKPTRMVAKIAGAVLAGMAVLSLASCGTVLLCTDMYVSQSPLLHYCEGF